MTPTAAIAAVVGLLVLLPLHVRASTNSEAAATVFNTLPACAATCASKAGITADNICQKDPQTSEIGFCAVSACGFDDFGKFSSISTSIFEACEGFGAFAPTPSTPSSSPSLSSPAAANPSTSRGSSASSSSSIPIWAIVIIVVVALVALGVIIGVVYRFCIVKPRGEPVGPVIKPATGAVLYASSSSASPPQMTYPQYPQPAMQQPQFYVQQQQQFPQQPYGQNPQQPYAQGQPLYAPPASDFGTYHTGSSEPTPPSSMMSEQVPAGYQQQQGVFYGQTNPYGHA